MGAPLPPGYGRGCQRLRARAQGAPQQGRVTVHSWRVGMGWSQRLGKVTEVGPWRSERGSGQGGKACAGGTLGGKDRGRLKVGMASMARAGWAQGGVQG